MTKEQRTQLDSLLAVDSGLSDWEVDFIDYLDLGSRESLTVKQANKLQQLYERKGL